MQLFIMGSVQPRKYFFSFSLIIIINLSFTSTPQINNVYTLIMVGKIPSYSLHQLCRVTDFRGSTSNFNFLYYLIVQI